ncbi:MAG TPA: hypothetical protein VKB38_13275 [Terracidiphilus sp.]|nr:hypothetical protein [Terracidiphilus sp.]
MGNHLAILALIQALQQEVNLLELQLAQMQSSTVQVASLDVAPVMTSTPEVAAVVESQTEAVTPAPVLSVPVSFSASGTLGYVTIANTLNEAIRVKDVEVNGTFDHLSFSDAPNWTFQAHFNCTGLGSLGYQAVYGNPRLDVCARHDNGQSVNEVAPGETMTIEYSGSPTGITTATIETDSGESVTF